MDLARIQKILSNKMAKQEPKRDMLKEGRPVFDMKKNKIGMQYDLGSGPLGARVQVMDNNPSEYNVLYQGKAQKMSPEEANDFFTANEMALNVPLSELMRKADLSRKQSMDIKNMNK